MLVSEFYLNGHSRLVVSRRGEDLGLAGGDGGAPGDEVGHYPAHRLDAQAQGVDVHDEHLVLHFVPAQNRALDCCPVPHRFVGVDAAMGLLCRHS